MNSIVSMILFYVLALVLSYRFLTYDPERTARNNAADAAGLTMIDDPPTSRGSDGVNNFPSHDQRTQR